MFIEKGSIVTCENGHEICECAEDISSGDVVRASQFHNFKNKNIKPLPKETIGDFKFRCNKCGGQWVKTFPYGRINLYLKDKGWIQ